MPLMKTADFLGTLKRMYQDSKILFEKGEYYNSCYLCGYVLECALKYILLQHGKKQDNSNYTADDLKFFQHNTTKLNQHLNDWLSVSEGVQARYRIECQEKCKYIFTGVGGYPHWDPKYRYGEHPKWEEEEYCRHYLEECEYIFQFVAAIVAGGGTI